MKRKRIVINLEKQKSPPAEAPQEGSRRQPEVAANESKRGLGRPLLIIGLILLVIIGGVIGGAYYKWRSYQKSPAYALALLADAAQRNDIATVDSLFDTEKITDDFVEQVRQRTSNPTPLPFQVGPSVPTLTPKMRQTAHDELVKELQRLTAPAKGRPFILVALAATYFADIKEENKVAHADVNIIDEQLQLTMQQDAGRWRITAVQDDKLTKKVADAVMKTIPSPKDQIQDQILKQLDQFRNSNK